MNYLPRWLNSSVTTHSGTLYDIRKHLPFFERRPFGLDQPDRQSRRENSRLDVIVRLPIDGDPEFVPVGVVSKDYALLPHTSVLDAAIVELENAEINLDEVEADVRLTENGERMALSLRLPDNYMHDPGDGHPITVRLECLNSVDGSTRFRAVMGWFRLICSNGLSIGVTRSDAERRHIGDLQIEQIGSVLRAGIEDYKLERDTLVRWASVEIHPRDLARWVETDVKTQWGFKAGARVWHIATTGHDVEVLGPYKRNSPTTVPVEHTERVPGSPEQSTTVFDASQVLAWLAKERRDIQEQVEWREQIPGLITTLARAAC